ncbi:MAG: HAD-IG family 5'-nucleotidase [Deltaproteobacteria bacterium]|nr:HAD-IG family 5'-nucleotidase [Deltaproteobacteria bacterium]
MARPLPFPDGVPTPQGAPSVLPVAELGGLVEAAVLEVLAQHPAHQVPHERQMFVNRNLRMDRIEALGFDMDYTLAIYHRRAIEELSFDMTLAKLVRERGYTPAIGNIKYDQQFVIRGLVVDREAGNLFKMDRFGHVGRAYHGRRRLAEEELYKLYREEKIKLSSERYAWIDTLFALPEACLYAEIIELLEADGLKLDYGKLYDDIRECIDTVHRDGSLKAEIRKDIGRFIFKDPELATTLHKLRSGGKKLFVATNSLWDYTDAVMKYLLDGVLAEYPSWRNYFDAVIVGANKPAFFSETRPFHEVDIVSGVTTTKEPEQFERAHVYQGGNLPRFEDLFKVHGEKVLYIGDHIYGDILRSRKSSLWRTCLVVQELEDEVAYTDQHLDQVHKLADLEMLRDRLGDEVNQHKLTLNALERRLDRNGLDATARTQAEAERKTSKSELDVLRKALKDVTRQADELENAVETGFNRYWGLLFKEGNENSRFGEQVEQYACVYTSRVSNLLPYSPTQYFRSPREAMPHERGNQLTGRLSPYGSEGPAKGAEAD